MSPGRGFPQRVDDGLWWLDMREVSGVLGGRGVRSPAEYRAIERAQRSTP
ncbi:hypothetical protein ACFVAV_30955 [Nocardia sp. NPDC057663]